MDHDDDFPPYYRQSDGVAEGCGKVLIWSTVAIVIAVAVLAFMLFIGAPRHVAR